MIITRDEFDAWRKDPVTRWIFAALTRAEEQEKAEWLRRSWENGDANPMGLIELRTRAGALSELRDNKFEDWAEWNGDPVEED